MHQPLAPSSLSSFTPPNPVLGTSNSFSSASGSGGGGGGMNLMQSHYIAGRNPGAYSNMDGGGLHHSSSDETPPPMQTGIASMMTTHGGNGGFSDFIQTDQPNRSDSSDEDLFSVSL
jgi:hypothetical protein|tara:strand:- start:82 stop:432 length:351 start_codon:yes stop_codon:yes gene_type:complete